MTTTITTYTTQDGRTIELRSDPAFGDIVHINGVIQTPGTYHVVGRSVFFDGDELPRYNWRSWFAWRPVKVKGQIKWMCRVYRKEIPKTYATYDDWTRYEYGDVFDILKDN